MKVKEVLEDLEAQGFNKTRQMKNLFFYVLAIISMASACRGTKQLTKAIAKQDTSQAPIVIASVVDSAKLLRDMYAKVNTNRMDDYTTFSAKIKVTYEAQDGEKNDVKAYIRMHKDSLIWISLTGSFLDIEGARILITPDSVKVMNKLKDYYQLRSIAFLQDMTDIPLDFKGLQDMIIGNPIFVDTNIVSFKNKGQELLILSIGKIFKNLITLDGNALMSHSKLDDVDQVFHSRTCDITLEDYEATINGKYFSTKREIIVTEKSKLDIQLKFKQFSFNEALTYPFNIPKNYKRK